MTNTYFKWEATFKNLPKMKQFNGNEEILFSEIEKNKKDLTTFKIVAENGEYYLIDLIKGEFDFNGKKKEKINLGTKMPQLIYSRRNRLRINPSTGEQLEKITIHRIGIKTDLDNYVIEVFPGLGLRKKYVKFKTKTTEKDVTNDIK